MMNDQDGNREQLELFLEHTAVVAWLKDEAGRLVFASNNYLHRFGWTRESAYGKTEYELWPELEADSYRKNDLKLLTEPGPIEVIEKAAGDVAAGGPQPGAVRIVFGPGDDEQELREGKIRRHADSSAVPLAAPVRSSHDILGYRSKTRGSV